MLKPSKKKLGEMTARRDRLFKQISRIDRVSEGIKSEFWKDQSELLQGKLDDIESSLDNFESKSDREVLVLLSSRKELRGFLGVKDYVGMKSQIQESLKKLDKEISDYKNTLEKL